MFLNKLIDDLNLSRKDIIYICAVLVFSIILTIHSIDYNYSLNMMSDSWIYMINALFYSGMQDHIQSYSANMFLTPVISFLTSILFMLGIKDKLAIFIVTGFIAIIGQIGLYLLLKTRFNELFSLFGCILFGSFTVVLKSWSNGVIDLPVCSFAILTILFVILATEKNPKYFIATSICLILAIFTKYVAFFLIPLLLLYYLSKHDFFNLVDLALTDRNKLKIKFYEYIKSREFKYILLSIFIAVVLFIGVCLVIISFGSGLTFITQSQDSLNGFNHTNVNYSRFYNGGKLYYVKNFDKLFYPDFFGFDLSGIILLICGFGVISRFINIFKNRKSYFANLNFNNLKFRFQIILLAILIIFSLYFYKSSYMITNIGFLIACVAITSIASRLDVNNDNFALTILFLAWLVIFLSFLSFLNIKSFRYIIILVPAIVYFVIWSIYDVFYKIKDKNYFKMALIIVMIILVCYSFTFTSENKLQERNETDLGLVYDFLVEFDPDYLSKNLTADYSYGARYGTFHLKDDVRYIRIRDGGLSNYAYIVSSKDLNLTNYTHLYQSGKIHLYQNMNYNL